MVKSESTLNVLQFQNKLFSQVKIPVKGSVSLILAQEQLILAFVTDF